MDVGTKAETSEGHDAQLSRIGNGTDVSLSNQTCGELEPTFNYGSMMMGQDPAGASLNNSLLNKGFEGGAPIEGSILPSSDVNNGGLWMAGSSANQNNHYQHNTVARSLAQETPFFASTSNPLNFTSGNRTFQPFYARRPSLLRNEYCPGSVLGTPSSIMVTQDTPQSSTSSPSRYDPHQQDSLSPQDLQAIQESNMRLLNHQARHSNTIHQLGYDPNHDIAQHSIQSNYHDLAQYRHHPSGQIPYSPQATHGLPEDLAIAQPTTPPNLLATYARKDYSTPSTSTMSARSGSFKREVSASMESPLAKKVSRKRARRNMTNEDDLPGAQTPVYAKSDDDYVREMVKAMNNRIGTGDNDGMISTWEKIRKDKQARMRVVCRDFLEILKRAHLRKLTEKSIHAEYPSFEHRFKETIVALRYQKTICKHVMDSPYQHVLADDPTTAAKRVINNRKVNKQKQINTDEGRAALGKIGQGKGKSIKQIKPVPMDDQSDADSFDSGCLDSGTDDEDFLRNVPSPVVVKKQSAGRKTPKKAKNPNPDDDYEEDEPPAPAPKKAKRVPRFTYKVVHRGRVAASPEPLNRSQGHLPMTGSSPVQRLEPVHFPGDPNQYSDYPITHVYAPTAPLLPTLPPEMYHSYVPYEAPFEQYSQPLHDYSSSSGHHYSDERDDGNANGSHTPHYGVQELDADHHEIN